MKNVAPPPTATPTLEVSATPTETGTPAGTASATATPGEGEGTATPTATETELTEPTATETEGVEPTETETEGVEPTATETVTGTPTGTVAATSTPSPTGTAPTATSTTAPTLTNTPGSSPSSPQSTATNTALPATATNTNTPASTATPSGTPTPTETPGVECPLEAGEYTVTQTTGGSLTVAIFAPFPFPAGGQIIMDTGTGDSNCVHDTVVAFPGGFTAPSFCVPALGFTVNVAQTSCGIGLIDSDGGSDFTIVEQGDTSDAACGQSQSGAACTTLADSSQRVDITVGDGNTDVCTGNGTANTVVSIPVFTVTWTPPAAGCPDPDAVFNPGTDTLITQFPQILDFTTDKNTASFVDLNADGCKRGGGLGPDGPGMATGQCLDLVGGTVTTGAAGTVASSGGPAGDLLFRTTLPNTIANSGPFTGATCASPPVIPLPGGTDMRCFVQAATSFTSDRSLRQRQLRGLLVQEPQTKARSRTRRGN